MTAARSRNVIDRFEQIDVAAQRRKRRRPKVCDTTDPDCGSNRVVYRLIEPAVGVLKARFIYSAATESRYVADLRCLVRIVQTGTATDGIQSTNCSRVHGGDVIDTVTPAQIVSAVDLVIDAGEEVRGIETRRHDSGADQRTGIIHRTQTIVNRRDCAGSNRQDRRVISSSLFEVCEKESPFALDWAADGAAVLRLR